VEDLEERGLLDSTLVIAMGEFGRTPNINPNLGRDHWPNAWSLALAGGGIKTGHIVGATDERGANVTERVVTMGDLFATIFLLLGIDYRKEYMSPIGRPIKIANSVDDRTGQPVEELLA
jgi:arylsulfatase A-like enzyme